MPSDFWDEFKPTMGDFVKFETVGDSVSGVVAAMRKQVFEEGIVPQLDIETVNGMRTLTAGQAQLKRLLYEQAPQVGDYIRVEYTGKRGKMKTFEVSKVRPDTPDVSDEPPF